MKCRHYSKMVEFLRFLLFLTLFFDTAFTQVNNSTTCQNFSIFYYMIRDQCPIFEDLRCVPYLPVDIDLNTLFCSTMPADHNNTLQIAEAEQFLKLIKSRDQYGRPWSDFMEKAAYVFPQLKVVAVDVSTNTRSVETLLNQYGIASTPVVALWESGYPRYRIHEIHGDSKFQHLVDVVRSHTDLATNKSRINETLDESREFQFKTMFYIDETRERTDWYFIAGVITLCFNIVYFILYSPKAREFLNQLKTEILD